jgi:hypothetical protein
MNDEVLIPKLFIRTHKMHPTSHHMSFVRSFDDQKAVTKKRRGMGSVVLDGTLQRDLMHDAKASQTPEHFKCSYDIYSNASLSDHPSSFLPVSFFFSFVFAGSFPQHLKEPLYLRRSMDLSLFFSFFFFFFFLNRIPLQRRTSSTLATGIRKLVFRTVVDISFTAHQVCMYGTSWSGALVQSRMLNHNIYCLWTDRQTDRQTDTPHTHTKRLSHDSVLGLCHCHCHCQSGCGKTSFCLALAGELKLDVCMLSLSNKDMNDNQVRVCANNTKQTSSPQWGRTWHVSHPSSFHPSSLNSLFFSSPPPLLQRSCSWRSTYVMPLPIPSFSSKM